MAIGDLWIGLGYETQPTETPKTDDTMNLQALLGKSADADFSARDDRLSSIDIWWTVDGKMNSLQFPNERSERRRGGK